MRCSSSRRRTSARPASAPDTVRAWFLAHLGTRQVARVVYGAIIGMAIIVVLEDHPPGAGAVAGELVATALTVALAEFYSEVLGAETRARGRVGSADMRQILDNAFAVAFGVAFPAVFFVLAAAGAMQLDTAFTVAKWSGVGLIAFYGISAARLAGARVPESLLHGVGVAALGALLIALKALVH